MLFWRGRVPGVLLGVLALALIAGCVPSSANTPSLSSSPSSTPTQTVTPTATPTWDADQTAAIDVVNRFSAADDKIGAGPSAYTTKQMTTLLEAFSGGEALATTLRWHQLLKKNGYRLTGQMVILNVLATRAADDGRGLEVHVTQCQDQRQGKVVDRNGTPVMGSDFQIPDYNLRQFSVRKPPGEPTFKVFGFETVNGRCP